MMKQRRGTRWMVALLLLLTSLLGVAIPAKAALTGTPQTAAAQASSTQRQIGQAERGQTTANLNLRTGPGTNFERLVVIPRTTTVALLGRNGAGDWLYVGLASTAGPNPTSVRGWVYAYYIQTPTDILQLPIVDGAVIVPQPTAPIPTPIIVTTPDLATTPTATAPTPAPTPSPTPLGMTITVNPTRVQANTAVHVLITDAPVEVTVAASIRQPNGSKQLPITPTVTDGKGLAALDFTVPGEWPDHTPITDSQLRLTISIPSSGITRVIPLHYQVQ
ncbi:MAG TPA: SH3 domain-containing protein [Caldilineaceae bacterium]|nr:SH3 domain-containing protein [Caldilineaceae bacterium]